MAAQKALKAETTEDKLNEIARAIYELAGAVRDIEDKVQAVQSRVNSIR